VDHLVGLKENVIIGKLIPAGTGLIARRRQRESLFGPETEELTAEGVPGSFEVTQAVGALSGNGAGDHTGSVPVADGSLADDELGEADDEELDEDSPTGMAVAGAPVDQTDNG
jgi:DNA-directed RNA polymerase subunit beta'